MRIPQFSLPEKTIYYNSRQKLALTRFQNYMKQLVKQTESENKTLIFLCIGSDRATGDCFGPLVGETLSRKMPHHLSGLAVYGNLKNPVHALNLEDTIHEIYQKHANPYIVAIDASLGIPQHIGYVSLGKGPLLPGIGVKKNLPCIGEVAITGIVNTSGNRCHAILQTTKLSTVVELSNFVSTGILQSLQLHSSFQGTV